MSFDPRYRTWMTSDRSVPRSFVRPIIRFSEIEASSGVVLLLAAIAAIIWANSAWSEAYFSILDQHAVVEFGGFGDPGATYAGVAVLLAHSLFKAALFMTAGVVDHQAHARDIGHLSGLGRRMPTTAVVAGIADA